MQLIVFAVMKSVDRGFSKSVVKAVYGPLSGLQSVILTR